MKHVTIIGGGWAGLSAAVFLSQKNIPIKLIEQSKQIGGRGRCIAFGEQRVDCGQHILFGSYKYTRSILKIIGVNERQNFTIQNFRINNHHERYISSVGYASGISPFNQLGILFSKGVFLKDKISTLNLISKIAVNKISITQDHDALSLLEKYKQSDNMNREFWNPLCMLVFNQSLENISAKIFINYIKQTFIGKSQNSKIFIPKNILSDIFSQRAIDYIEQKGGSVSFNKRARIEQVDPIKIDLENEVIDTDYLIIATSHRQCQKLLSHQDSLSELHKNLEQIPNQTIHTLYLQYPSEIKLPYSLFCVTGERLYWLTDRSPSNQSGTVAVKFSTDQYDLSSEELANLVIDDIAARFPDWPKPTTSMILKDSHGILCEPGIGKNRPGCETPVKNLFLAGDYINSGLPANLETAVMSGILSAQKIFNAIQQDGEQ